mmetsp:Transcript_8849/g.26335  ORF Transcript_8849/g.26335 Transcript_8849/m.26335 type:complete len:340 (-) Transcript_8849:74-1093(-)
MGAVPPPLEQGRQPGGRQGRRARGPGGAAGEAVARVRALRRVCAEGLSADSVGAAVQHLGVVSGSEHAAMVPVRRGDHRRHAGEDLRQVPRAGRERRAEEPLAEVRGGHTDARADRGGAAPGRGLQVVQSEGQAARRDPRHGRGRHVARRARPSRRVPAGARRRVGHAVPQAAPRGLARRVRHLLEENEVHHEGEAELRLHRRRGRQGPRQARPLLPDGAARVAGRRRAAHPAVDAPRQGPRQPRADGCARAADRADHGGAHRVLAGERRGRRARDPLRGPQRAPLRRDPGHRQDGVAAHRQQAAQVPVARVRRAHGPDVHHQRPAVPHRRGAVPQQPA